jgi:predicted Rossmann fold nucleotide-binding protein DprA/Smf involved in DNA uptake
MSEEIKQKILDFLGSFKESEKGVATAAEIKKGTGLDFKTVQQMLKELDMEGKIVGAGRAAGVFGYKLKT